MFGLGRKKISAELLARNLTCILLDADDCWTHACRLRGFSVPGPIATTEIAFARAALVWRVLRDFPDDIVDRMHAAWERTVAEIFEDTDTDVTRAHYGSQMRAMAEQRIAHYSEVGVTDAALAGAVGLALRVPGPAAIEGAEEFRVVEGRARAMLAKVRPI